jgi:hypothetical protein
MVVEFTAYTTYSSSPRSINITNGHDEFSVKLNNLKVDFLPLSSSEVGGYMAGYAFYLDIGNYMISIGVTGHLPYNWNAVYSIAEVYRDPDDPSGWVVSYKGTGLALLSRAFGAFPQNYNTQWQYVTIPSSGYYMFYNVMSSIASPPPGMRSYINITSS